MRPTLEAARLLPPIALRAMYTALEASFGEDATSRIDDKFKSADAQLRQGVCHLLRKEYQKAYELCDQTADPRGQIYSALSQLKEGWDPVEPRRRIEVYLRTFETPMPQAAFDPVVLYACYLAHKLLKPAKEHRLRASLYLRTFALFEAEAALWLDPNKDTVEKLMENDDDDPLESASASLAKAQWERYKLKHPEIKSSAMDKLMAMVGLERIKRDALNVAYSVELASLKPADATADVNRHFVFIGNPGTSDGL
jgi:hypothetical protein